MKPSIVFFIIVLLLWSVLGLGQMSRQITYQGYLTDSNNNPITNNLLMTFTLYNALSGGNTLWEEIHSSVSVIGGVFRVILGSNTPLNLSFDAPYWLGIKVGNDPELAPRIALTGVGYSFHSLKADSAENISCAAGGDLTGNLPNPLVEGIQGQPVSANVPASGQVLKWTGSAWAPAEDNAGSTVWATSGNDIYNLNSGNVGIGTNSPQVKLDVVGTIKSSRRDAKWYNGAGSSGANTLAFQFLTEHFNYLSGYITKTTNAVDGDYWTINKSGVYSIVCNLALSTLGLVWLERNGTPISTSSELDKDKLLAWGSTRDASIYETTLNFIGYLAINDIIRVKSFTSSPTIASPDKWTLAFTLLFEQ